MDYKVVSCLFALAFISFKIASAQCINNINDLPYNIGPGQNLYNSIGSTNIVGIPNSPCLGNSGTYNSILDLIQNAVSQGQISVTAENLVIEGPLAVSGSLPVYGAVAYNGDVPSSGQASLVYNAGSGVSLDGSNCGQNLGGFGQNFGGLSQNLAGFGQNLGGLGQNLVGLEQNWGVLPGQSQCQGQNLGFDNAVLY